MAGSVNGEGTSVSDFAPNVPSAGFASNAPPPPQAASSPNAPAIGGSASNTPSIGSALAAGGSASNVLVGGSASSAQSGQKRIICEKKNIASGYGLFCAQERIISEIICMFYSSFFLNICCIWFRN